MMYSDPIPIDLIIEILSRLGAKSIGRFRCVSKLWGSILLHSDFTKQFLTRSYARPRLLFGVEQAGVWSFYSSPQPQHSYGKSWIVVHAEFHSNFNTCMGRMFPYACNYASGLIYLQLMEEELPLIFNPITGEYMHLPEVRPKKDKDSKKILGFDPVDRQFKLLCYRSGAFGGGVHKIVTLGRTNEMRWREIQYPFIYNCFGRIYINGVLYILTKAIHETRLGFFLVCFDVRSEIFKFLDKPISCGYIPLKLINYKGKFSMVYRVSELSFERQLTRGWFCLWVLEDIEKQEWSRKFYALPKSEVLGKYYIVGGTATGEIVLSGKHTRKPFYLFFFNPERNTLRTVEIQGLAENCNTRVKVFVDHVEHLTARDARFV